MGNFYLRPLLFAIGNSIYGQGQSGRWCSRTIPAVPPDVRWPCACCLAIEVRPGSAANAAATGVEVVYQRCVCSQKMSCVRLYSLRSSLSFAVCLQQHWHFFPFACESKVVAYVLLSP